MPDHAVELDRRITRTRPRLGVSTASRKARPGHRRAARRGCRVAAGRLPSSLRGELGNAGRNEYHPCVPWDRLAEICRQFL